MKREVSEVGLPSRGTGRAGGRTRRLRRNLVTAGLVTAAGLCIAVLAGLDDPMFAASMSSAYVGLGLICATLLPGPLNVLSGRPNPVSTLVRRDLGIWAGAITAAHVVVGLQRHMGGRWQEYFLVPGGSSVLGALRHDPFGVTNWLGLWAALICAGLLFLSNDWSLVRMGPSRWKRLQRFNYALLVATALHAAVYQIITDRPWPWIGFTVGLVTLAVMFQGVGFARVRSGSRGRGSR